MREAFRLSLPVMAGYLFLGMTYGMLAHTMGFSIWYPLSMALFIYSGSTEFLALGLLGGSFNPWAALGMALVVGARHLFYGISMLERYSGTGWRKPFLIFWLTDETFAVNYNKRDASPAVMLWVSGLDYAYWLTGGILGYLFGSMLPMKLEGLGFVVTAMFVAIFTDQMLRDKERRPAWIGMGATALCLVVFGGEHFVLPSMGMILLLLLASRKRIERKEARQ